MFSLVWQQLQEPGKGRLEARQAQIIHFKYGSA